MPDTTIAVDRLEPLEVRLKFATQITLDRQLTRRDRLNDVIELLGGQIFRAELRIHVRLLQNLFRGGRSDTVNIRKRCDNSLVARDFNSK
jgi:hypothetical protein